MTNQNQNSSFMTLEQRSETARRILEKFSSAHPEVSALVGPVSPRPDPVLKPNHQTDVMRLRLIPIVRRPRLFWAPHWCFYEIAIGQALPKSFGVLTAGTVRFVQFPANKMCGGGRHRDAVASALREAATAQPAWFLQTDGESDWRGTYFGPAYPLLQANGFTVAGAAADLAELIQLTLPNFVGIGPKPRTPVHP